jgi:flagella basal body P-ring formation protein FlgA
VEGDRIFGKDLAAADSAFAVLDPDKPVGYAPAPGVRRVFSKAELERLAAAEGRGVSARFDICFERPLEVLTRERILAALESSLNNSGARLELVDFCRQPVPRGEIQFPRSGLGAPAGLIALWRGRVDYGNRHSVPVWAKVRLSVRRLRVVAATTLAAGKAIQAGDLRVETCDQYPFGEAAAVSIDQVAGQAPRHLIPAGQPIPPGLLVALRDVERGETVMVEVGSGSAHLRLEARAESGGHAGESIVVRNPASGNCFRARIAGKGKVVVETDAGGQDEESVVAGGSDGSDSGGNRKKGEGSQAVAAR